MDKKTNDFKKLSGFDLVKTIGYILVIILIFSPLTFLVSNTITGTVNNDCYNRPAKVDINGTYDDSEMQVCQKAYDEQRITIERQQFLIVSIISIIAIASLLFLGSVINSVISYSLFFGASLNTVIIVMKNSSSSIMAAGLGIVLFILVIVFINKNLKK